MVVMRMERREGLERQDIVAHWEINERKKEVKDSQGAHLGN